jgi:prephenate dehydratase
VIERKIVDYAVLPIENSLIGKVAVNDKFLATHNWSEVGELFLPIRLYLIGSQASTFDDLESVESHPAALAQCRSLFYENPQLKPIETENTAASVKAVVESGDKSRAAIGSLKSAEIFDGKILKADVQDRHENYTKFLLLKK